MHEEGTCLYRQGDDQRDQRHSAWHERQERPLEQRGVLLQAWYLLLEGAGYTEGIHTAQGSFRPLHGGRREGTQDQSPQYTRLRPCRHHQKGCGNGTGPRRGRVRPLWGSGRCPQRRETLRCLQDRERRKIQPARSAGRQNILCPGNQRSGRI